MSLPHSLTNTQIAIYEAAVEKLRTKGAKVVYPLDMPGADRIKHGDNGLMSTACKFAPLPSGLHVRNVLLTNTDYEFNEKIKEFISCFEEKPGIKDLASVIEWNKANAEKAMPERMCITRSTRCLGTFRPLS